jgi:hypothetical protein
MPTKKPTRVYHQIPEDYPDEYLNCRVDRHSWERPDVIDPHLNVPYGYPVYRECFNCGALWIRSYNRSMTLKIYERRVYPPDYLLRNVGYADTRPKQIQYVRLMIEREGTPYVEGNG